LHDAQTGGGGQWQVSRSRRPGEHPLALEAELREAIAAGQFVPYFQPVVRIADSSVTGCEALARWHHPSRGVLAPAKFIRLAERCNAISDLGTAILRDACAAAADWPAHLAV